MASEGQAVKRKQQGVNNDGRSQKRAQPGRDQDDGGHHPGRGRSLATDERTVGLAPVADAPDSLIGRLAAEKVDCYRPGSTPPALEQAVDDQTGAYGERGNQEDRAARAGESLEALARDPPDQARQQSREEECQNQVGAFSKCDQQRILAQGETGSGPIEGVARRQVDRRKRPEQCAEGEHRRETQHDRVVWTGQG